MTQPTTKSFKTFFVEVGDPANPSAYFAPVGFVSKSLTMSKATSDSNVPSIEDPESSWAERAGGAKTGQVQGNGVMTVEDAPFWETWFDNGGGDESRPIRIRFPGLGYRAGNGILTNLGATAAIGSDANKVQRSVTIDSDGPWLWTAGDPA